MSGKKLLLCAVRDGAMQSFAAVMTFVAMGQAQRSFSDEVNRKESSMNAHPEDYELWMVGLYDEDSGRIEPCNPECVCRGKDVIVKEH